VLLILAGSAGSLVLLLAATATGGVGQGLAFLAAMTEINHIAPPDRRGEVLSSFYVVTYLGTGLPVIGVGFLATAIGLLSAVQWFAGVVAAGCVVALTLQTTGFITARQRPGSRDTRAHGRRWLPQSPSS
jgi:MFS family permease